MERSQDKRKPGMMAMMQEIRRIEKRIERLEDSIKRLDAVKYRCTSNVSGMPRGGQKSDWYDIDAEIDSLGQQIAELRKQHTQLVSEMDKSEEADALNNDEYSVLKYRYISEFTVEMIAEAMKMSSATVYRKLKSATSKLDDIMAKRQGFDSKLIGL